MVCRKWPGRWPWVKRALLPSPIGWARQIVGPLARKSGEGHLPGSFGPSARCGRKLADVIVMDIPPRTAVELARVPAPTTLPFDRELGNQTGFNPAVLVRIVRQPSCGDFRSTDFPVFRANGPFVCLAQPIGLGTRNVRQQRTKGPAVCGGSQSWTSAILTATITRPDQRILFCRVVGRVSINRPAVPKERSS